MRVRNSNGTLSAHAVAGTHVVLLGMDVPSAQRRGLLGFAIHREDKTESESYWLKGMRTFEATYPNPPEGALTSTWEHPIQDFMWSDFTAKPDHEYVYTVQPVYGKPKALVPKLGVSLEVKTESESAGKHAIFFNRGVIGSQAYVRKWAKVPDKLSDPVEREKAWRWLSRGLEEAVLKFIRQAKDGSFALRAAVYEFGHAPVAKALGTALQNGADVQLIYDARIPFSKGIPDEKATKRVAQAVALIDANNLQGVATARKADPSYISHNKFIVLLKNGVPQQVWTGSANFSRSGFFGQANVGHIVRDRAIAKQYLEYWKALHSNPEAKDLRTSNLELTPTLDSLPPPDGITAVFSPRKGLDQLQWYADALDSASSLSCFTGAFGVNARFLQNYSVDRKYLRYLFLEKWGVDDDKSDAARASLRADPDVQVAVGSTLKTGVFNVWKSEVFNTISRNVRYVHTKFLMIDPLSEDPIVVTGSANFSDASTDQNDENMLVIRGDKRVADIYLGEFMRLWRHHNFRMTVVSVANGTESHNYLTPDDSWTDSYFRQGTVKNLRRKTFA